MAKKPPIIPIIREKPLSETKFFHYIATAMSVIIITLMGWIGVNVADIPVIKNQLLTVTSQISPDGWIPKKFDDHESRIRNLERK